MQSSLLILAVISLVSSARNPDKLSDKITPIVDANTLETALADPKTAVLFHIDGCPHCQSLKAVLNPIVDKDLDGVKVMGVNCNQQHSLCAGVNGYPTLMQNGKEIMTRNKDRLKSELIRNAGMPSAAGSKAPESKQSNPTDNLFNEPEQPFGESAGKPFGEVAGKPFGESAGKPFGESPAALPLGEFPEGKLMGESPAGSFEAETLTSRRRGTHHSKNDHSSSDHEGQGH